MQHAAAAAGDDVVDDVVDVDVVDEKAWQAIQ